MQNMDIRTHIHIETYAHKHTLTHTRILIHTNRHTHTYILTHTHTYIYTHALINPSLHDTHTYTHTDAHTHTSITACIGFSYWHNIHNKIYRESSQSFSPYNDIHYTVIPRQYNRILPEWIFRSDLTFHLSKKQRSFSLSMRRYHSIHWPAFAFFNYVWIRSYAFTHKTCAFYMTISIFYLQNWLFYSLVLCHNFQMSNVFKFLNFSIFPLIQYIIFLLHKKRLNLKACNAYVRAFVVSIICGGN